MEKTLEELKELLMIKDSPEKLDQVLVENLIQIIKQKKQILHRFRFTAKNFRLQYLGDIRARELCFWNDVLFFKDKYSDNMIKQFFAYWSENSQDGKKMRWEREKTWEISKRLATWNANYVKKNGY